MKSKADLALKISLGVLVAALAGCEMGLKLMGVGIAGSGVQAAMEYFSTHEAHSALQKVA